MKKYLFAIFLFAGVYACKTSVGQDNHFGAKIDDTGAITMQELVAKMSESNEMAVKVTGKVSEVCQAKGCWMTLEKGDGTTMRVSFTDYGFFMPKDISGKTVVIQGRAKIETTSVDELRHYAEDAKKSKEEIAKITEPKRELAFEADGVIVK
ncbi:MAG: DUF4920 domain-containing protein [Bacteroidetes bacterium]|nr:DUF4920 domain-containing protein [Bacteroidota bacterium]